MRHLAYWLGCRPASREVGCRSMSNVCWLCPCARARQHSYRCGARARLYQRSGRSWSSASRLHPFAATQLYCPGTPPRSHAGAAPLLGRWQVHICLPRRSAGVSCRGACSVLISCCTCCCCCAAAVLLSDCYRHCCCASQCCTPAATAAAAVLSTQRCCLRSPLLLSLQGCRPAVLPMFAGAFTWNPRKIKRLCS